MAGIQERQRKRGFLMQLKVTLEDAAHRVNQEARQMRALKHELLGEVRAPFISYVCRSSLMRADDSLWGPDALGAWVLHCLGRRVTRKLCCRLVTHERQDYQNDKWTKQKLIALPTKEKDCHVANCPKQVYNSSF